MTLAETLAATFAAPISAPLSAPLSAPVAPPVGATDVVDLAIRVQQIPAPTFHETDRAAYVHERLREGCPRTEVRTHDDGSVNVYARAVGRDGRAPALLVSAHTDTVFPPGTDLDVRRVAEENRVYAPGIGDNSLAVAALIHLARAVCASKALPPCDVWFVANAAEEGLGDLRGIRAAIEHVRGRHDPGIGAAVVLEGLALGSVYHSAIAVRRYGLTIETAGGHSWGDHGAPSAVHEMIRALHRIAALELDPSPRTTLNVGWLEGGTSVNTIAARARAEIDLRSETTEGVEALERRVLEALRTAVPGDDERVRVWIDQIGNRPAGRICAGHPLVAAARSAVAAVGLDPVLKTGSTDANALLAAGIPSVCVGVSTGGGAHRSGEYVDLAPVGMGMRQLAALIPDAARIAGESARTDEAGRERRR